MLRKVILSTTILLSGLDLQARVISSDLMVEFVLPVELERVMEIENAVNIKGRKLDTASKQYANSLFALANTNREKLTQELQDFLNHRSRSQEEGASSGTDESTESPLKDIGLDKILDDYKAKGYEIRKVEKTPNFHVQDDARTSEVKNKRIEIPSTFNPEDYHQPGEDACYFLSYMAAIMNTPQGRNTIKKLLVGQDEGHVYFKFYGPGDGFVGRAKDLMDYVDEMGSMGRTIFKVPRNVIKTNTGNPSYPKKSPGWLHLLMRAYRELTEYYKDLFVHDDLSLREKRFADVMPYIRAENDLRDPIMFSPLINKEIATIRKDNYDKDKALAIGLKDILRDSNLVGFAKNNDHHVSILVDQKNVVFYDVNHGNKEVLEGFDNLDTMDDQEFLTKLFSQIGKRIAPRIDNAFYFLDTPL